MDPSETVYVVPDGKWHRSRSCAGHRTPYHMSAREAFGNESPCRNCVTEAALEALSEEVRI